MLVTEAGGGGRDGGERLLLRRWREEDSEPFAAMNADPEVMRLLGGTWTRARSEETIATLEAHFDRHGFGLWALELQRTRDLLGFVGLNFTDFDAHFTPAVEVGWRLRRSAWGHGHASEAARAALAFGFERLQLEEIVSMTALANRRSQAVMKRIGMTRAREDDFDHPHVPPDSPLLRHMLYRLRAPDWHGSTRRPRAVIV
jgi:RimJ/RimL family protein N-acetyltransferase